MIKSAVQNNNRNKWFINFLIIFIFVIAFNCSQSITTNSSLYPLQTLIPILPPNDEQKREFDLKTRSEFITPDESTGIKFSGYKTNNKKFLEEVITPLITPHLNELRNKSHSEIINVLTLFGYEIYQTYFGKNFYRWGGDILDLDDPQESSVRYEYSYGLDCSGFSALPYELAVHLKLLTPEQALFSSKGFETYCSKNNLQDIGGRDGTSNNFRLDTPELAELGEVVFHLEKGQVPTEEQISLLQPGDIVGRSGHFGIIAFVRGEPYYFESGGWVVPKNDGIPVKAKDALKIFASNGSIMVRRCLVQNPLE